MACPGPKPAEPVLSDHERQVLGTWVREQSTPRAPGLRARIVPACDEMEPYGLPRTAQLAVAAATDVVTETVSKWQERLLKDRLDGLGGAPRLGPTRPDGYGH